MKNHPSSNSWQPCPDGLIRRMARRMEVEQERKSFTKTVTGLFLLAGFLVASQEYRQAPGRRHQPEQPVYTAPLAPPPNADHCLHKRAANPLGSGCPLPSTTRNDENE